MRHTENIKNAALLNQKKFRKYVRQMFKDNLHAIPLFLFLCAVNIGMVFLAITAPDYIGKAVDEISVAATGGTINAQAVSDLIGTLILIYAVTYFVNLGSMVTMNNMVTRIFTKGYRTRVSRTIKTLPIKYTDNTETGDILSRMMEDVSMLGTTAGSIVQNIIGGLAQVIGITVAMFLINAWLALAVLVLIPVSLLVAGRASAKSSSYFEAWHKEAGELNAFIEADFSAHNVIKAYNLSDKFAADLDKLNDKMRKTAHTAHSIGGIIDPLLTFVSNIGYIAICILGAYLAINGVITIGAILTIVIYARMFRSPLEHMGEVSFQFQRCKASAKRLYEMFYAEPMDKETDKPALPRRADDEIKFENVSFGYNENLAVKNFSLDIKRKQKIAIVGPTGCGKTTLVNLLMRFYDAQSGDIKIDGQSIYAHTRESVRDVFGMVLQDVWLRSGTIRENIVYGNENATEREVEEACRLANVDRVIKTLPDGFDTVINEDATNLSSGQKQLITIARAILADKPVLILDEATSNVDSLTELLVQQAMTALMREKTSFIIAHRLSTIVDSDLIAVMKDGQIIERGRHEELLKAGGFYSELFYSQFKSGAGETL